MNLFNNAASENLLSHDGIVNYYRRVLDKVSADNYFQSLVSDIEWKNDEAVMFGKKIITKRKVAWYGERNFSYSYSNTTKYALPWTKDLLALRLLAEQITGADFNSCLLNLYHDGNEGMSWHSDNEKELEPQAAIASFSFGAERKFSFKHKQTNQTVTLMLEHGSLLNMHGETQKNWLHRLPPMSKIKTPRINLTFRKMAESLL